MDFQQAEKRFRQLKAQFEAGTMSEPEFKVQLEELMIQDEQGSWWMIGSETERWYRYDGTNWVQADPPSSISQKPTPVVAPEPETMEMMSAENAAREKAVLEKQIREDQERSKRISQESAERESIQEVGQFVTQKSAEQQLIESEEKESILVEDTQKVSIWKFGGQEVIRGIIGTTLYLIIHSISPSLSSIFGSGWILDLSSPILVFFGIAYGPWVGLMTGLFGDFLSANFTGMGFNISTLAFSLYFGIIGLAVGLTKNKFGSLRSRREILTAIGFYFIINIITNLIFATIFDYLYFIPVGLIIVELITGSVFLTILMIAFATVVRRR